MALDDVVVGGITIARGSALVLDVERAGRDPSVYPDPESVDLDRQNVPSLAFGGGQHPCMGSRLARAEIAAVIETLLARFALHPASQPAFRSNRDLRQFQTFPLRLERRE